MFSLFNHANVNNIFITIVCVFFIHFSVRATTTSTDDVDLLAIDLFATMVQQYEAFITLDATKIIAEKFKSTNADEVLLALNVNIYTMFNFSMFSIQLVLSIC